MTHHATLVRADSVSTVCLPGSAEGCDVQDRYIAKFGIEDARDLVYRAHQRPANVDEQLLVTRTDFITLEAQNALLKILEEPPVSTRITFVIPCGSTLLNTLTSRFSEVTVSEDPSVGEDLFEAFLDDSFSGRLGLIELSVKKKDVDWQRAIKRGLIKYLNCDSDKTHRKELEYIARTLLTRGASNKMLLEHAALILKVR